MTAAEVGELLRMPVSTVQDWARRRDIPSRTIGTRRFVLRDQIEALLRADDS